MINKIIDKKIQEEDDELILIFNLDFNKAFKIFNLLIMLILNVFKYINVYCLLFLKVSIIEYLIILFYFLIILKNAFEITCLNEISCIRHIFIIIYSFILMTELLKSLFINKGRGWHTLFINDIKFI